MLGLASLRQSSSDGRGSSGGEAQAGRRGGPLQAASKLGERLRGGLGAAMSDTTSWVLAGQGLAAGAALYGGLRLTLGAYRCAG